ncbi:N-acetyltransferase [Asticcacaulis endophyticus]|nr:N-acetyltransferase [Asticcacaulis endophyticus]
MTFHHSPALFPKHGLRPFNGADRAGVNRLWEQVWWPQRSEAGWDWIAANPVLTEVAVPQGWVIKGSDGEVLAFLGAFAQRFWQGGRAYHAVTGHSLVVSPTARGASRALIHAILAVPDMLACYTLNANVISHKLYGHYGFKAFPAETHNVKLSWVTGPITCLAGRGLRRLVRGHDDWARKVGERFLPRSLWRPFDLNLPENVRILSDFEDYSAYSRFWEALRSEGRLIADRSPAIQRWRLSDPDATTLPVALSFGREDAFGGYAVAMFNKPSPIEPVALEIIDIMALDHAPEAVPALMTALKRIAAKFGAAKLRLPVVNDRLMRQIGPWVRTARREGGWSHAQVYVHDGAPDISSWQPTAYDGDHGLCLRPPPRRVFEV